MKIKLRNKTDQHKYDLYQVGNVIVEAGGTAYLVSAMDGVANFGLVNLESGEIPGDFSSLRELADEMYASSDRLMVNPTLVEEGAE